MLIKLIFWCFVIYCLYRFVFELVIPVSKTVSKMKQTVQQMQENQGPQQPTPQSQPPKEEPQKPATTNTNDEYIEFEEVK
ncbi:MAG: hypothetical protein H7068_11885 [Pedobacter sp.]|nr:hypothetical protein [Chitinophagaceae bacterium]